jgi:hypothetical protein
MPPLAPCLNLAACCAILAGGTSAFLGSLAFAVACLCLATALAIGAGLAALTE